MKSIQHLLRLSIVVAATLAGASAAAANLTVLTAWYGQSCNTQHGNVTAHMKSRCDGKETCQYVVDAVQLGDPAPGCAKNLVVLYACQGNASVRLSQVGAEANGKTVALTCTP